MQGLCYQKWLDKSFKTAPGDRCAANASGGAANAIGSLGPGTWRVEGPLRAPTRELRRNRGAALCPRRSALADTMEGAPVAD